MKKFLLFLAFVALVVFGIWRLSTGQDPSVPGGQSAGVNSAESGANADADLGFAYAEELPRLGPVSPFRFEGNERIVHLELSDYGGYAGLIVANGGLEPNEQSSFFRDHGFKVRLTLSEDEDWSLLNSGQLAGVATTVDVAALYAPQIAAVIPGLIGFSRGLNAVVVREDITRLNQLRGRTVVVSPFNEAEFMIRYLAQEAGLQAVGLKEGQRPSPDVINLVYAEDAFAAGDLFIESADQGSDGIAGVVTWGAKVREIRAQIPSSRLLATNRNLLIVADVLLLNRSLAQQHPEIVTGLVDGMLQGNHQVRQNPQAHADLLAKAFGWSREEVLQELSQVHLANWPENRAFFSGEIDAAGSYGGIFQSALMTYGRTHDVPAQRLLSLAGLDSLANKYSTEVASIQPIRTTEGGTLETNPLLSRDIRFHFQPNSAELATTSENDELYRLVQRMVQVSPGSTILLRGHVDDTLVEDFRKQGGDRFVRQMALRAMELSQQRANAVRDQLVARFNIEPARLEAIGRGWDEPIGNADENRRVEVQWFLLE
jgi:NitT/TauT family transport system substrate-binding protein